MAIHHSQRSRAEKNGYTLEERGSQVMAFHPKSGVQIFGVSVKDAMAQMEKFTTIYEADADFRFTTLEKDPRVGFLRDAATNKRSIEIGTPTELYKKWGPGKLAWVDMANRQGDYYAPDGTFMNADGTRSVIDGEPQPTGDEVDNIEDTLEGDREPAADTPDQEPAGKNGSDFAEDAHPKEPPQIAVPPVKRNENGVPYDGAIAYREGITAADCPYSSEEDGNDEYEDFVRWNEEWDNAADEAEDEDGEKSGSVVASKYRTKYKEMGHANHCGDWLAELLNNYVLGDKNTDLERFEEICNLNEVDTSKYKRDGVGWQGRIRMTGRNLLAKKVFQRGYIIVPNVDGGDAVKIEAPADWLSAQRYSKPEAK